MIDLNTEIASFFLFHPDDLEHRRDWPSEWPLHGFAIVPEFTAGNFVAFDTGADATFRLRLTSGDLTDAEKAYARCFWDFRYKVRHGRVLIDGGDFLPAARESSLDDIDDEELKAQLRADVANRKPPEDQWFRIANGDYRVRVHAIDWEEVPGAVDRHGMAIKKALPAYVVQFREETNLTSIAVPPCMPRLEPDQSAGAVFHPLTPERPITPIEDDELPAKAPVFIAPHARLVPGYETPRLTVPAWFLKRLRSGDQEGPAVAVFVTANACPIVAPIGEVSEATGSTSGDWMAAFRLTQLVRVTKLDETSQGLIATIGPFRRPASEVEEGALKALQAAFANYARTSRSYAESVRYAQFEAGRVGAMRAPAAITDAILHHLDMPTAERERLLPLSDAERVVALKGLLDRAAGG